MSDAGAPPRRIFSGGAWTLAIDAQNNPSVPKHPSKTNQGRPFAVTSRPDEETLAAANPSFSDGVATKDIHIDPLTSLSLRIFLPNSSLSPLRHPSQCTSTPIHRMRRHSLNGGEYRGYLPTAEQTGRRLPVILQFHGGGFVSGSGDSVANDFIAVGYRLAPENKYPTAFDDGLWALYWLAKQSNLVECSRSMGGGGGIGGEGLEEEPSAIQEILMEKVPQIIKEMAPRKVSSAHDERQTSTEEVNSVIEDTFPSAPDLGGKNL
ncbi:putative carboxylesterase 16 [Acorus calamus]|uniref:Carboxylesterase 16 n=1 Tax=Acorus calamus TaxID=4465 RepID=A0AAV9F6C5_ACOCL|nr:putative carboxylesterase 16 [Acorus calamus]